MTPPALEGRYGTRWLLIEAGSSPASGGMTKNTAVKVAIPAAVLRSSAPRATPISPATVTYRAAPMTDRRASGAAIDTPRWWLLSSAWPRKKETKLATSETEKIAPTKTASFPQSTGRRRGTAVSEERIIPVLYSPLISSTPSTPKATTAKMTPLRLVVTGLKAAFSAALNVWYWLAVTAENSAPIPIISTTAVTRVYMVDRSDRNLVNSESSTRAWVTFSAGALAAAGAAGVRTALIGPPPPQRHRGNGSRRSRR